MRAVVSKIKASIPARFVSGSLWSIVGAVMSKVWPLAASIAAARLIGPSLYGALAIVQSTIVMLQTIAGIALSVTASRFVAEYRHVDPGRAARVVALSQRLSWSAGFVAAVALVAGCHSFASTLGHPELALSLALGGPMMVGGAVTAVQTGILAGLGSFRDSARLTTISSLLTSGLAVGGVAAAGVPGFILGSGLGAMVTVLIQQHAVSEALRVAAIPSDRNWKRERGVLLHYALPAALCFLANVPSYWLTNSMLVQRSGLVEMGIFNAAFQWRTLVIFIPSALNGPMVAMLAGAKGRDDAHEFRRLIAVNGALTLVITGLGGLFMGLAAPMILSAYGKGFVSGHAEGVALLLVASAVPGALSMIVMQAFSSAGGMWVTLFLNVVWGATLIAYFVLSSGDARALAEGHVVSASVQFVVGIGSLWLGARRILGGSGTGSTPQSSGV